MNSNTVKHKDENLVWSNGSKQEKSPRLATSNQGSREESAREYINPVARALLEDETWTVGDDGDIIHFTHFTGGCLRAPTSHKLVKWSKSHTS
jgi:hypothetical protein